MHELLKSEKSEKVRDQFLNWFHIRRHEIKIGTVAAIRYTANPQMTSIDLIMLNLSWWLYSITLLAGDTCRTSIELLEPWVVLSKSFADIVLRYRIVAEHTFGFNVFFDRPADSFTAFDSLFKNSKPRSQARQLMTMEKKVKEALQANKSLKVVQCHR